jgi:hypothetical protein
MSSRRPGLSTMVNPYPDLPSIYVPEEKQESSTPEKTGKPGTKKSWAYSWATPQITRGTATECGIQKPRRFFETRDMVFLNRMFFKSPKLQVKKKQVTNNADLDSLAGNVNIFDVFKRLILKTFVSSQRVSLTQPT